MEDLLVLYAQPYDPREPVILLDELPVACTAHTRDPLPPAPGQVAREDYEYERRGSGTVFIAFQPLAGWRALWVQPQRTRLELADVLRDLVDVHFPEATRIRLVCDNLNTHTNGALYLAFPGDEAGRIMAKLDWHFTPKHASWLNMAESELSVLVRQCLKRRLPDQATMQTEADAWAARRNRDRVTVRWTFTVEQARVKLRKLYPVPAADPAADPPVNLPADASTESSG